MGEISKADFMEMVRVELDRNRTVSPLVTATSDDPDTLELDEVIEQQCIPALRLLFERAPLEKLYGYLKELPSVSPVKYTYTRADGVYYIELPEDFLRLALFQAADWPVAVTEAITDDDPRASLFASQYAGISGNAERPRCLLTYHAVGTPPLSKRVLVYYSSSRSSIEGAKKLYIPVPRESQEGVFDIPDSLLNASVSMCAALVCRTLQDEKGMQLLEQKTETLLT